MSQQKLIPQTFLQVEQKLAETERLARRPQQEHKLKQCLRQLKTSVRDLKAVLATTGIEFLTPIHVSSQSWRRYRLPIFLRLIELHWFRTLGF